VTSAWSESARRNPSLPPFWKSVLVARTAFVFITDHQRRTDDCRQESHWPNAQRGRATPNAPNNKRLVKHKVVIFMALGVNNSLSAAAMNA
jgi:hypothetical protein